MPYPCPSCRSAVPDDARFCPGCGALLRAEEDAGESQDLLRLTLERKLGHQYTIKRLIGRGGMGAVYLAHEEALDRMVAIKVLPPEASDATARERFKREARTAARLQHPNIVPLHTFGVVDEVMYFVMGYVEGESLGDLLARERTLDERRARAVLADVANALGHAHELGIVHRDIKPDNILIDRATNRPLLSDFGIAKATASAETLTAYGSVVGTPYYMSPEQATGERQVDGRSDLYSLGVVGYQMLSGRLPFEGDTLQQVLMQKVMGKPHPLDALAPEVSDGLRTGIMRCLGAEPGERWTDAREFEEAVRVRRYGEGDLPVPLKSAPVVTTLSLAAMAIGLLGLMWGQMGQSLRDGLRFGAPQIVLSGLLVLGALLCLHTWREGRRRGFARELVLRAMFRPPHWWPWRLPATLRPADDVWDRLPGDVVALRDMTLRRGTVALVLIGAGVPVVAMVWSIWLDIASPPAQVSRPILIGMLMTLVAVGTVLQAQVALTHFRLRKRYVALGLSREEAERLLDTPTFGTDFWERRAIAAVLKPPPSGRPGGDAGDGPLRSVEQAIARAGPSLGDLRPEVERAARDAARLLDTLEREIEVLRAETPEHGVQQLELRLSALQRVGSPDDVRALLEGQLSIARRLVERLAEATKRRERIQDTLDRLLGTLADTPHGGDPHTSSGDRVRRLCAELSGEVAVEDLTVRMGATPSPGA